MLRVLIIGFGSVGQTFCEILIKKNGVKTLKGKQISVVGVSDSSGGIVGPKGLDLSSLLQHKTSGNRVTSLETTSPDLVIYGDSLKMVEGAEYDLLIDASPVDLKTGGAGLASVRHALGAGKDVVLANKAPLVLQYRELNELAEANHCNLSFSATVCGGLPVINVGRRDLVGAKISKVEGIFNSTSNYILSQMAEGSPKEEALKEAQRRGIAETDPSLDLSGYDTANKLIIITNSILNTNNVATLGDVEIKGIEEITEQMLKEAEKKEEVVRLVATAILEGDDYSLKVAPTFVPKNSFLGLNDSTDMCCIFYSDIYETTYLKTNERGVYPTSAAVLRDLISYS